MSNLYNYGPPTQGAVSLRNGDSIKWQAYIQVVFPAKPANLELTCGKEPLRKLGMCIKFKFIPANTGEQKGCSSGTRSDKK